MAVAGVVALALTACSGAAQPSAQPSSNASSSASRSASSTGSTSPTPSSTKPTTSSGQPCPGAACVTLVMTGDVLLHPPLWDQARSDARADGSSSDFDFRPLLAGQKAIVSGADVALCHLETPLAK